jgi:hypothetical protein
MDRRQFYDFLFTSSNFQLPTTAFREKGRKHDDDNIIIIILQTFHETIIDRLRNKTIQSNPIAAATTNTTTTTTTTI